MANVENSYYEVNGYGRFILNAVEVLPNPRNGEKRNRNFSGEMRQIQTKDGIIKTEERFCNFVVPRDMVEKFERQNIDMWLASEPNEDDGYITRFSKMKIKFNEYTNIFLVEPNSDPVKISEATAPILDGIRIRNADVELGRSGNPNKRGKYSLWVRTLYIYQDLPQDPFAYKFEHINNEPPFEV